ncbi:DUF2163 domain-containing protein [Lysobacter korlensis]|uniref:DUF2163 domain-containing protein n=1 Tax=Lysobacter korlensis TaxID=553636 RepID=A0ABV6RKP7_9GAMM
MKTIPATLQAHYDEPATTTTYLCRMQCKDGTVLGFTSLDADLTFNDGAGPVLYRADNGFRADRMQATADLAVDNTDLHGWVADTGITEQQIRAGLFDYARIRIYRVNYLDLAAGHEIIATGTAGETKFSGSKWSLEFRSLTQQLKQPISKLYSRTCRAKFGSQPVGTAGEQPTERHPCRKAWTWIAGTVTAVNATEPDRLFTDTGLTQAQHHFVPGVVEWVTGQNAGAQMEVDAFAAGAVTLTLPLAYPIAAGDTFRIRQDCDKTFSMCGARHANTLNFRGEHLIPNDGGQSMVPGAQIERA